MYEEPPDPLYVIRGDMTPVHCLLFDDTNDTETLYVGTEDGTVQVWDLKACRKKQTIKISEFTCLSLNMLQKHLLTQDKTCTLKLWQLFDNFDNFECIISKEFDNISFCKISVLQAENTYLVIPQRESVVLIYSFSSNNFQLLQSLKYSNENTPLGEVLHLKLFNSKDNYVAVIYESGVLIIWDLQGAAITYDKIISETPMAFDFDPYYMQGICGATDKNIVVFRLNENLKITKQKTLQITNPGTGSLCVRSDSKILAAGCWDGKIRIFSWKTCKLLAALDCHRSSILHVCFSHFPLSMWNCKQVLAAASNDKRISLWKIYD